MTTRIPIWALLAFAVLAIAAGVLGVTHAPSTIAKVVWTVLTIIGLASLGLAHRTWKSRTN